MIDNKKSNTMMMSRQNKYGIDSSTNEGTKDRHSSILITVSGMYLLPGAALKVDNTIKLNFASKTKVHNKSNRGDKRKEYSRNRYSIMF